MKLHLFYYDCKSCGHSSKSPELFGNPYGEFLLKTNTGKIAYLNAIDSSVFKKEFSEFLKNNVRTSRLSATKQAKILHRIFYITCDPADDGSIFSISQKPDCEQCGQNNIGHWGVTEPAEIVDLNVGNVKHKKWTTLNKIDKELLLDKALDSALKNNADLESIVKI